METGRTASECQSSDRLSLARRPAVGNYWNEGKRRNAFLGTLVDCHAMAVKAGIRGLAALPETPAPLPAQDPAIERAMVPAGNIQVEEIRLRTPRGAGAIRNVFTRTGIWTNLQRGTWVEFARNGGSGTRARLTWISPNKGVYLFTNPLSTTAALSISPEALAEEMRRGEARIVLRARRAVLDDSGDTAVLAGAVASLRCEEV